MRGKPFSNAPHPALRATFSPRGAKGRRALLGRLFPGTAISRYGGRSSEVYFPVRYQQMASALPSPAEQLQSRRIGSSCRKLRSGGTAGRRPGDPPAPRFNQADPAAPDLPGSPCWSRTGALHLAPLWYRRGRTGMKTGAGGRISGAGSCVAITIRLSGKPAIGQNGHPGAVWQRRRPLRASRQARAGAFPGGNGLS